MTDLCDRLRKTTRGLGSEDPGNYSALISVKDALDAAAEIEQLRARVAKLEKALEPFAKAAEIRLCGEWQDGKSIQGTDIAFHIWFGDLRTARTTLSSE